MCGLTGFLEPASASDDDLLERVAAMAATLMHRGPDDGGTWVDQEVGYAVGFRRLAIVDLTPTGHQPMTSNDGRWVVAFNGEIYNHRDLRADLSSAGVVFRGTSDTEVLVEAFARWGVDRTIDRLNGMFAIAAWDRSERQLTLARDPMGEKPLFVGRDGRRLLFASELKALRAGGMSMALRPDSVATYLRWGFVPGPDTMLDGIDQIPLGTLAMFDQHGRELRRRRYFDPVELAAQPENSASAEDLTDQLDELVTDAVRLRLEADVPVGAFLSGGVDSSLVCGVAQAQGGSPVRTFSVGFDVRGFDESAHAEAVARHLGTRHSTMQVSAQECLDVVPHLATMFDVPFADPSAIATYQVARLAREHVTVTLSGDGGDELFGGYDRYRWADTLRVRTRRVPRPLLGLAGSALRRAPTGALDVLDRRTGIASDRLRRLGSVLDAPSDIDRYQRLLSLHPDPASLCAPGMDGGVVPSRLPVGAAGLGAYQLHDQLAYLPDDILTKVDRTTMAVSLEGRIPLLDPRVVRFAWTLPVHERVQGDVGKVILRRLLHRYVPPNLVDRPKAGFALPIADWLRGPLREWAEPLVSTDRLARDGLLDATAVRSLWNEHQRGERNRQYILWAVLMLQDWVDAQRTVPAGT